MFEVGFMEMLLIAVLALVVLGPERLPRVAAQLGRWVGRARAMARQFREQLEEEASLETARRPSSSSGTSSTHTASPYTSSPASPMGAAETSSPASAATATPTANSSPDIAPPPEVVASTPAHEIDSNDTQHADLSQEPAIPAPLINEAPTTHAAGQSHERGT